MAYASVWFFALWHFVLLQSYICFSYYSTLVWLPILAIMGINPFLYTLNFVYGCRYAKIPIWYCYYSSISLTLISSAVYEWWYSTWIYGSSSIRSDMDSLLYSYGIFPLSIFVEFCIVYRTVISVSYTHLTLPTICSV